MAKDSQIEWTHHTFNPWWGCSKVSPACDNCYAEAWAKRMGHKVWGLKSQRRFFGDAHWRAPLVWNSDAEAEKRRERVFCASMADVFEKRSDLDATRARLWSLIESTPWLDWLLLTKRPENIASMVPWSGDDWPKNIWLGTTVENQRFAEKRLPHLLQHKSAVRFLSCEPLLGPIDLEPWIGNDGLQRIDWVIAGGESGHGARAMHPQWATGLLHQCQKHGIAFHFKQWGHWAPQRTNTALKGRVEFLDVKGSEPVAMIAAGKKASGRQLAGRVWDGLPARRGKRHA